MKVWGVFLKRITLTIIHLVLVFFVGSTNGFGVHAFPEKQVFPYLTLKHFRWHAKNSWRMTTAFRVPPLVNGMRLNKIYFTGFHYFHFRVGWNFVVVFFVLNSFECFNC
jgi:hypothetical protein